MQKDNINPSLRGSFTFAILLLQERLSYLSDSEKRFIIPFIQHIDLNSKTFWNGTILTDDGSEMSNDVLASYRATSRIILNLIVHGARLGITEQDCKDLELTSEDKLELNRLTRSSAKLTFSTKELNYLQNSNTLEVIIYIKKGKYV